MNYRSVADLNETLTSRLSVIPRDIDLVVGIPRSGMLAANLLALHLNLPVIDVEGFIEGRRLGCGVEQHVAAGGEGRHELAYGLRLATHDLADILADTRIGIGGVAPQRFRIGSYTSQDAKAQVSAGVHPALKYMSVVYVDTGTGNLVPTVRFSGMLAANLLALHLNLPVIDVEGFIEGRRLGCGVEQHVAAGGEGRHELAYGLRLATHDLADILADTRIGIGGVAPQRFRIGSAHITR